METESLLNHLLLEWQRRVPKLGIPRLTAGTLRINVQCRSEISEQRRRKMNARDTRIRVFFDASKIAYRIRVCAFVIHNHNFAFPVLLRNKRINCVTADKSKICIRYVALITVNFDPQMPPMKASTGHYFGV